MAKYAELMKKKEEEFEKLSAYAKEKEAAYKDELINIENELLRIQGEYRILSKLLEEDKVEEMNV